MLHMIKVNARKAKTKMFNLPFSNTFGVIHVKNKTQIFDFIHFWLFFSS